MRSLRHGFALAFGLLTILVCWSQRPWDMPLPTERGSEFYLAERVASGIPPHMAEVAAGNQGAAIISGTGIRIGRVFSIGDVLAGRMVSTTALAFAVGLSWELAFCLSGSLLAGHLTALALLGIAPVLASASAGFDPFLFVLAFTMLALLATARDRWFTAGLGTSLAFVCWQPAGILLPAVWIAALFAKRSSIAFLGVTAGVLVVVSLYEACFVAFGVLPQQLEQALGWLQAGSLELPSIGQAARAIFLPANGQWSLQSALPLLAIAGTLGLWEASLRTPGRILAWLGEQPGWAFLILGGQFAAVTTALVQPDPGALFFLHPFTTAAAGLLVAHILASAVPKELVVMRTALALLCIAPSTVPLTAALDTPAPQISLDSQKKLAALVDYYADHGGSLWVTGCSHLLGLRHQPNFVPWGSFGKGVEHVHQRRHPGSTFRPERNGRMPAFIADCASPALRSAPWLAEEYSDITPANLSEHGISIHKRRPIGNES